MKDVGSDKHPQPFARPAKQTVSWDSKSTEYSNNERRKREYGELLQHVKDVTPEVTLNQMTSVHFIHNHIYMAKAAAERLFLSRRFLKCLTKIESNNIGIDTHASLHEQICWVIFADLSSFM